MNPIKSIQARYQGYCARNFEKTKYGKILKKYKDAHNGEICFVIGNGPSLSGDDLTILKQNNIPTFASNNVMKIFRHTNWRPTYYVCEDVLVLKDLLDRINEQKFENIFIPINFKWYDKLEFDNAKYFYQSFCDGKYLSDDIAKTIYCKGTVTTTSIQIAAYMGFKKIYLLGVDHNYRVTQDNAGNIITDNSVVDYFDKDYASTMKEKCIPNTEATTVAYIETRDHYTPKGIEIFNATRGGKLEVFPRVNFDDLFKR